MLLYGAYRDPDGQEHASLYYSFERFFSDTFSPACEVLAALTLKTKGKTYHERKANARNLAIQFSNNNYPGLSWGELAEIQAFFEKVGKRYGLLTEFRENAII